MSEFSAKVTEIIQVKNGFVANIDGYPWFMSKDGNPFSYGTKTAFRGMHGDGYKTMKLDLNGEAAAFNKALSGLGITMKDGASFVLESKSTNLPIVDLDADSVLIARMQSLNLFKEY